MTNYIKSSWKQVVVSALVAVYLAVNLFKIGGDAFVINLNNFTAGPLALGVTLLALSLWRQLATGSQNRLLWSGLTIGWALWTIAEIWWAIASLIWQEVPYPSWADLLWLGGYIPLYIALWARMRSLPKIDKPAQQIGIGITSLLVLGSVIFFILVPIIQNNSQVGFLEGALNILYPLTDLILLILVLQIFFNYQGGMYGAAWRWLTLGFIFMALGDFGIAYLTTANLYYPNQQVNFFSTFCADIPYNLSYLLCLIGLVKLRTMHSTYVNAAGIDVALTPVPNTHLLVFTRGDDKVIDVSHNYSRIFEWEGKKEKALSEVLGISTDEADRLLKDSRTNHILEERTVLAHTRAGQQSIQISGIAVYNPQMEYAGVILLLRLMAEDYALDKLLTRDEEGMVRSLLEKTGAGRKEELDIKQLLVGYYQQFLRAFYNRSLQEGGSIMADSLISELQRNAKRQNWPVEIQSNSLMEVSRLTLPEVRKVVPAVLEVTKQFIARVTDETVVNTIVQDVRAGFSETVLKNISYVESAQTARL